MHNNDDTTGDRVPMSPHDNVLMPQFTESGHPDEGTIHAWLDSAFDDAQSAVVESHVTTCAVCQGTVAEARGFIAGAARIATLLDAVPSSVVGKADVVRTVSRIVADATAVRVAPRATRAWYHGTSFRIAATLVVFVGSATVWSRMPTPSVSAVAESAVMPDTDAITLPRPGDESGPTKPVADASRTVADARGIVNQPAERVDAQRSGAIREERTVGAVAAGGQVRDEVSSVAAKADAIMSQETMARRVAAAAGAPVATPPVAPPLTPPVAPPAAASSAISAASVARESRVSATGAAAPQRAGVRNMAEADVRKGNVIVGRVLTNQGKGIAAADVMMTGDRSARMLTDSTGTFAFNATGDRAELAVRRLGFLLARQTVQLRNRDTVDVRITLEPALNRLAAVVTRPRQTDAGTGITQCLSLEQARTTLSTTVSTVSGSLAPTRIRLNANSLSVANDSTQRAMWFDWPDSGKSLTVTMTRNSHGDLHGEGGAPDQRLELSLIATGDTWEGEAVSFRGPTRVIGAVRYGVVGLIACR